MTGHTDNIGSTAFSPDGTCIASAAHDCTIRLWDGLTGEPSGGPLTGHVGRVHSVAFSPNGMFLASSGKDRTIRIWDVEKRLDVRTLEGHTDNVLCVTFSPDGQSIYSSSSDRTIRCWDVSSGSLVGHPLAGHSLGILSLAVSHDGHHIASGAYDKTVRVWDTNAFHLGSDQSLAGSALLGPEKIPSHIEDDGWLRTIGGGLLLYIPAEHRRAVCDMSNVCISQEAGDQPMRILWDRFCHGEGWTEIGKRL